jgi:GNAT superfamily N-acetyltransferase
MAIYKLEAFPRRVQLRNGTSVEFKPMEQSDGNKVLEFFLKIPEDDRYFLKDDVTSPRVIEGWCGHMDYDRALPILAWDGDDIVGDAVLIRSRMGARRSIGEVRVVVHPDWRNRGLGSAMIRQLCDIAADADLEKIVMELVGDRDVDAITAAERLGFLRSAVLSEYFSDQRGHKHDLIVMVLPLGKWYEWWTF